MGLRQGGEMENRQRGSAWPVDESIQFSGNSAGGAQRSCNTGIGQLEIYQQQQRSSPEERMRHLKQNVSLQDRIQQGQRSMSLPGGGPGMSLDDELDGSWSRFRYAGTRCTNAACWSSSWFSGIYSSQSNHPSVANMFHQSHLDAIEDSTWRTMVNYELPNDWKESRIQLLQIYKRHKRHSEAGRAAKDPSLRMSVGSSDDTSKRLLTELLQQKRGHQTTETFEVTRVFYDKRIPPSSHYPLISFIQCSVGSTTRYESIICLGFLWS